MRGVGYADAVAERARPLRRRFVSAGAVLGNGFRTWFRGFPVALMVVLFTGALPVLGGAGMYFDTRSDLPVEVAATAYANTSLATWFMSVLSFAQVGVGKEAIFFGVFSLAACYAGTGLLASLLYSRRTAGTWRATSVAAIARLAGLAVLTAFLLVMAKAVVIGMGSAMSSGGLLLLIPATILEGWLVSRYWLVIPILAIEHVPLGSAFRRSLALTRGSGVAVFGVVAVLATLTAAVLIQLGAVVHGVFGDAYAFGLTGLLMTTIQGAMLAEGYRHLHELREGPDEHTVAAVFE